MDSQIMRASWFGSTGEPSAEILRMIGPRDERGAHQGKICAEARP
jgi:hypothetical protein